MRKILIFIFFLVALFFSFSSQVSARSGCCSHHGGVCGCGCCDGTSLSATCAPYYPECGGGGYKYDPIIYAPPQCTSTVGNQGQWTFSERDCAQDITITWTKGINDESFSIGISKTAGADPGPKVDTNSREWTFEKVKPGIWYINLKAGSSTCTTSKTVYWKVEVPPPETSFSANIGETDNDLHLQSKCIKSIATIPSIGELSTTRSVITPISLKKKTKISFTAYPLYGKAIKQIVEFDPGRVIPTPTPITTPIPTPKPFSFWDWLLR